MSNARSLARRCAIQALYTWQLTGNELAVIDNDFRTEHDMSGVEIKYFQEILHQVVLHKGELDDHLALLLDRPIGEVDPVERAILRMGVYELEFRLDVPYRVVINEAVELAKTFGAEHGHKYVNGILDGVAKKLRSAEVAAKKRSPSVRKKKPEVSVTIKPSKAK
ncbi:MAG: transcription antitermination factor NusB [Gammaproteobacteria bacterium]|nr:transcription antitermination factor NusB [Gammaproteobacteria bacterium]MCF6231309.1 transcription antitermination factor NusB [Gammaproteobacteria bacterium]